MTTVRFATYNLLNLDGSRSAELRARQERVHEVIRGLDADIVAVQEILNPTPRGAEQRLMELAAAVGMECIAPSSDSQSNDVPAVAAGPHGYNVALLWRPDRVSPVPGSFRSYGVGDFFHGLVKGAFDIDGQQILHASHHATPFGQHMRRDQAERVVSALTRPVRMPALIGADWNTVGADRSPAGTYYDPDPYRGQPWNNDLIYQCTWKLKRRGERTRWRADRGPGEVLVAGGLRDAAAVLNAPWNPTVGHWSRDPLGWRRIDGIRVTPEVVQALRGYEIVSSELARAASDHLPVIVSYDPAAVGANQGPERCPHGRLS